MSAVLDFARIYLCGPRLISNKIDTNNDGVVTKDELKAWITHSAKRCAAIVQVL